MSTEENKALVRRYYEEVLTKRNPEHVDELFASDYVFHYADAPSNLAPGLEGLKQFVPHFLSGYPDLIFIVEDQTAEGDKVTSRITAQSSRPVGPVMTIPANPEEVAEEDTITGTSTDRIANGKIAESWFDFKVPNPLPQLEELGSE
jgi:predicted ester cyclase